MYEIEQLAVFGNPFGNFHAPNFPTRVYVKKVYPVGTVVLENFRRAAINATALAAFEFAGIQHIVGNAGNGFTGEWAQAVQNPHQDREDAAPRLLSTDTCRSWEVVRDRGPRAGH